MKALVISIVAVGLLTACASQKKPGALIQDCPEEKIVNRMPQVHDDEAKPNVYYIYKGKRREVTEFDAKWLEDHCTITETVVH